MPTYDTPGVYYERMDASAPAISAIRTDIAGFVGIAVRGPLDTAVPVQSWRQFQAHFGQFTGAGFLAYAVRAFFENGGRRCWVVRVASKGALGGAAEAEAILQSPSGKPVWRVAGSSPGIWANELSIIVKETHRAETVTDPSRSRPESSAVASVSGFKRGTMVRLSQDAAPPLWKVVSEVDPIESCLSWVNKNPELRLPYDSPLQEFNPDRPVLVESVEYTLIVRQSGIPIALFESLSLVPEHGNYGPQVLAPLSFSTTFDAQQTLPLAPLPVYLEELRPFENWRLAPPIMLEPIQAPAAEVALAGGADGLAALKADDFIGEVSSPLESDELRAQKRRGLAVFGLVDEVAIISIPDINVQPEPIRPKDQPPPCVPDPCLPQQPVPVAQPRTPPVPELPPIFSEADIFRVQAAMVGHCEERHDRIALLDPPLSAALDDQLGTGAIRAWRSRFDSKYAALYYPWLRVVDPLRSASSSLTRDIPPSGHVAGQYARTDIEIGVHKAPANAPLSWVQDVTVGVGDAAHGFLNPAGINVIRPLPGRGLRIMGARTVSSDADWRYLNVRRLMMMIEKAIDIATQWAVFEPNDFYTRAKLHLALSSFLIALWQRGALAGKSVEEAFFVRCDETNNPPEGRESGRLVADVGVAPSNPFEFIVVRVGRTDNEFEVTEYPAHAGGA